MIAENDQQLAGSRVDPNSLARTYGGTVRRFEIGTEYPNPRMIVGKKREMP
jgi:hypothetical protein